MLSHRNIDSNVSAVEQLFRIKETDVLLGILPFFHSFGFTGTLWMVLSLDPKGVLRAVRSGGCFHRKRSQPRGARAPHVGPVFQGTTGTDAPGLRAAGHRSIPFFLCWSDTA